jgi:hypothetical protein
VEHAHVVARMARENYDNADNYISMGVSLKEDETRIAHRIDGLGKSSAKAKEFIKLESFS